ncbi:MAG: hypothetical protein AAF196_13520 [Planctomycetota bacterium]
MTEKPIIPSSYEGWRECIEVRCKTPLTPDYVQERLKELENQEHPKTQEFEKLYGTPYREQVTAWFRRAAEEAAAPKQGA